MPPQYPAALISASAAIMSLRPVFSHLNGMRPVGALVVLTIGWASLRFHRACVYRELEKFIYGKSTNDISDKNQLSECIASGIDCFITTDNNNILGALW